MPKTAYHEERVLISTPTTPARETYVTTGEESLCRFTASTARERRRRYGSRCPGVERTGGSVVPETGGGSNSSPVAERTRHNNSA